MGRNESIWIVHTTNEGNCTRDGLEMTLKTKLGKRNGIFFIAVLNNAIRSNYVKTKLDNIQNKSKNRLCSERNKTFNHIILE